MYKSAASVIPYRLWNVTLLWPTLSLCGKTLSHSWLRSSFPSVAFSVLNPNQSGILGKYLFHGILCLFTEQKDGMPEQAMRVPAPTCRPDARAASRLAASCRTMKMERCFGFACPCARNPSSWTRKMPEPVSKNPPGPEWQGSPAPFKAIPGNPAKRPWPCHF